MNKFIKYLLIIQGVYFLFPALWALLDIDSFMEITGYKYDVWLVKTVGAVTVPIAIAMLTAARLERDNLPVILLAFYSSLAFLCVDAYYVGRSVISEIYLVDGGINLLFLIFWIPAFRKILESSPDDF